MKVFGQRSTTIPRNIAHGCAECEDLLAYVFLSTPNMSTFVHFKLTFAHGSGAAQDDPMDSSALEALLNCINILLGCGILTIPYALKEGGWAAFVVLAIMGASTNYTGKMLIKCQEYYVHHPEISPPPGSSIRMKGRVMQTCDHWN